jgi:hypothetical protein
VLRTLSLTVGRSIAYPRYSKLESDVLTFEATEKHRDIGPIDVVQFIAI